MNSNHNSSVAQVITEFGCANGGTVVCPNSKLICQDGSEVFKEGIAKSIDSLLGDKETCVCADNKLPVCADTMEGPKCPGGEDAVLDKLPAFLQGCEAA